VFTPLQAAAQAPPHDYASIGTDAELVERIQRDYVEAVVSDLQRRRSRVLVWADAGFDGLERLLGAHLSNLGVVGLTNEHVTIDAPGPFGLRQVPLNMIGSLDADAVLIAGFRTQLAARELRTALGAQTLGPVRQFNMPFAHARVVAPGANS